VNCLSQTTNHLINIKTDPLHVSFDDSRAILELCRLTFLLICGPASFLQVRLTLVLENYLLHFVTVWVFINTISSNIGLSNVRVVLLNWRGSRILGRWWRRSITSTSWTLSRKNITQHTAKAAEEEEIV